MSEPRTPPAPKGLGRRSRKLWRDIAGAYELRPDELAVLTDACREVDLIDRLEEELDGAPLIVNGSQGQPVANPMVQELRQHRTTLKGLLAQLKLPDEDDEEAAAERSSSARKAAMARWHGGKTA